ncbi:MAG: hypothetical protein WCP20_18865 [Desulfuromonadales bacterium]
MQSVSNFRLQHQGIPVQQRLSGLRDVSPDYVTLTQRRDTFVLPEDVAGLSVDRSAIQDSSGNKKPSIPVTQAEKMALQDSFSVFV